MTITEKQRDLLVHAKIVANARGFLSLHDVYKSAEKFFEVKYPSNHTVRDTIRRLLQELRDLGFLVFVEDGVYWLTPQER